MTSNCILLIPRPGSLGRPWVTVTVTVTEVCRRAWAFDVIVGGRAGIFDVYYVANYSWCELIDCFCTTVPEFSCTFRPHILEVSYDRSLTVTLVGPVCGGRAEAFDAFSVMKLLTSSTIVSTRHEARPCLKQRTSFAVYKPRVHVTVKGKCTYTWYSASSWNVTPEALRYGTCFQGILPAHPHVDPQSEWPAFAFPAIAGTHLPIPEGWKAELACVAGNVLRQFTCPKAVTHPTIHRAECRATVLIENNTLPLH